MARQNIYDDECFFEGYKKIRQNEINANTLFEIPELFALLPDLNGKTILDMGCGFGEHCTKFVELGAATVVGIDISKKMLEVAEAENGHPSISYIHMPIEEISKLHKKFDIVISSLAMHYVENYEAVVRDVYQLLKDGGIFVFSQEHPLTTCFSSGDRWTKDENGKKLYLNQRIIAGNAQFAGIAAGRGVRFTTGLLLLGKGLGMRDTPIRPHSWH